MSPSRVRCTKGQLLLLLCSSLAPEAHIVNCIYCYIYCIVSYSIVCTVTLGTDSGAVFDFGHLYSYCYIYCIVLYSILCIVKLGTDSGAVFDFGHLYSYCYIYCIVLYSILCVVTLGTDSGWTPLWPVPTRSAFQPSSYRQCSIQPGNA